MTDAEHLAKRERCTVRQVNLTLSLAFLAPQLVKAAVEGRLPRGINIEAKAHYYFMDAVYDSAGDGRKARTIGHQLLMMRKFKDLKREVHRCDAFVGERMRGNPEDPKTQEVMILAHFVVKRARPFLNYWEGIFAAVWIFSGIESLSLRYGWASIMPCSAPNGAAASEAT